eukprot:2301356-Rhodomonas_salina.1
MHNRTCRFRRRCLRPRLRMPTPQSKDDARKRGQKHARRWQTHTQDGVHLVEIAAGAGVHD